ncbi:MAG: excisionase family DNA-binding protein [Prevotellaceae bacterium]|nr:excisionase family DNA-binding protein [Prevotellaceae bacterium]
MYSSRSPNTIRLSTVSRTNISDSSASSPSVTKSRNSEYLGVSRESIFQWIENRGMLGHKVGRLWKFKISEIDSWIKSGKSGNLSDGAEDKDDEEE